MKTKLYIPVVDTDTMNFDYKGREISREEYLEMLEDTFRKNEKNINRNIDRLFGNDERNSDRKDEKQEYLTVDSTEGYHLVPCETLIIDSNHRDADENFFKNYIENGKMFIIIIDINPDSIDFDSQTELRYWIADSDRILLDNQLDNTTKLKTLPKTHFGIDISNEIYVMTGCKLFEMYKEKNHPYKFAILVEKIKKL